MIALALEYPIALPGGVSVLVAELIRRLADQFPIVLVSTDRKEDLPPAIAERLHDHISFTSERSPKTARALANQLIEARVSLVHFHSGGNYGWGNQRLGTCPIPYLSRRGISCLHTVHLVVSPLDGYCGPHRPLWFKLALLPLAYTAKLHQLAHSQREIAVSLHDFQKLKRWYFPFQHKIVQHYHSILEVKENPPPPSARKTIILSVGHIAFRKGQHVLTRAFAALANHHPDWELWMAGHNAEPACWEEIEAIIQAHHLQERVRLLGPRPDAATLMKEAAIFVQPSRWEALGLALQEALFYGCACIGTRAGGIPELLANGSAGLLVPPDDPPALATALETLIQNSETRFALARAGRSSILTRQMNAQVMADFHAALYRQTLHASRPVGNH